VGGLLERYLKNLRGGEPEKKLMALKISGVEKKKGEFWEQWAAG